MATRRPLLATTPLASGCAGSPVAAASSAAAAAASLAASLAPALAAAVAAPGLATGDRSVAPTGAAALVAGI